MQRPSGCGWPTDENHDPAATGMQECASAVQDALDKGEVDRMQSFGAPAVELGKAPAHS